jgi:uncharacterized protein (DUF983 family)
MTDPATDAPAMDIGGQPGAGPAALFGLCPRCGAKTLFSGAIKFAPKCRACGLDFDAFNVGDGPAAFLTLIIGTIVTGLAIWLELAVHPRFWVHVAVWVPLTVVMVILGLRAAKALLIRAEYRRNAGQHHAGGKP